MKYPVNTQTILALLRLGDREAIAERSGVSYSQVSQVIHGRRASRTVREAIAAQCRVPVWEIFPDERKDSYK